MDPDTFGGFRPLVGTAGYTEACVVANKNLGKEGIVGGSILAKENGDQQFPIPISFHPLPIGSFQGPANLPGHLGGRGGQEADVRHGIGARRDSQRNEIAPGVIVRQETSRTVQVRLAQPAQSFVPPFETDGVFAGTLRAPGIPGGGGQQK